MESYVVFYIIGYLKDKKLKVERHLFKAKWPDLRWVHSPDVVAQREQAPLEFLHSGQDDARGMMLSHRLAWKEKGGEEGPEL